ncbi:MAG: ZIP family zinc transporter [Pseudomonadota bacterium]
MIEAAAWGALASSTLLLGGLLAYIFRISTRLNAIVMAIGAGLLLGSVSYDLVEEALEASGLTWVAIWFFAGSAVFVAGDLLLDRMGADQRKNPGGAQAGGSAGAIAMGSVLDGIPESFVLGLTVVQGSINVPLLFGVAISNLPEGMASSSGLRAAGWPAKRVIGMWSLVLTVSALSAAAGYALLDPAAGLIGPAGQALAQAFAAGALLTMLCDTMLPEAFDEVRDWTGALVVLGFAGSIALSAL